MQVMRVQNESTLPAFNTTLLEPIVPPPPILTYPLPNETLTDTRYRNTANHWWTVGFDEANRQMAIFDQAPMQNFLSNALYKRASEKLDPKLLNFSTFSNKNTVPNTLVKLNGDRISNMTISGFFGKSKLPCLQITPTNLSAGCVRLANNLQDELDYFRRCIQSADKCEYGLSLAIWAKFENSDYTELDVIISTAPHDVQGFAMYLTNSQLIFELRTSQTTWSISAPFEKVLYRWTNIAVTWGKETGEMKLFVNHYVVASKVDKFGTRLVGTTEIPQSIWLGCHVNIEGTIKPGTKPIAMSVYSVTIWYWPIQLPNLLTGGQEIHLLSDGSDVPTLSKASTQKTWNVDYTKLVKEFEPFSVNPIPENPIYLSADFYLSMQSNMTETTMQDVAQIFDPMRNRRAYLLKSADGFIKLREFSPDQCPDNLSLCNGGLSIGMWIMVPSDYSQDINKPLNILHIANWITISISNGYVYVYVSYLNAVQSTYRFLELCPKNVWFNLGLSIRFGQYSQLDAYVNAVPVSVRQVASAPQNDPRDNLIPISLVFGSATPNCSPSGVAINDLVLWNRYLLSDERGNFVGYTRSQQLQLEQATYYWTPDAYILQDSSVQIEARNRYTYLQTSNSDTSGRFGSSSLYHLASIYQPRSSRFRFAQLDHADKSPVPIFDMKSDHYLLLGRVKTSTPALSDLTWQGQCLNDPEQPICKSRGFTVSLWIKLISTGPSRTRFYVSTGNEVTSRRTTSKQRGLAMCTDINSFVISVALRDMKWQIQIDASDIKSGLWINIGILWSQETGLNVLLNGTEYDVNSGVSGYPELHTNTGPPVVVLGRLNTDSQSEWLTPIQAEQQKTTAWWEMSNFVFGEMAYFDRRISTREYCELHNLFGQSMMKDIQGQVWHGLDLIDPPLRQSLEAVNLGLHRPSLFLSQIFQSDIQYISNQTAVKLMGVSALRVGVFSKSQCPASLEACSQGLSVGGWYRIGGPNLQQRENATLPVILLSGSGGQFGIAVQQSGQFLGAWINQSSGLSNQPFLWSCLVSNISVISKKRNNQWLHLAVVWTRSEEKSLVDTSMDIYLNGAQIKQCFLNETKTVHTEQWMDRAMTFAVHLQQRTNSDTTSSLLISSNLLQQIDASLHVARVALAETALTGSRITELMGIENNELSSWQQTSGLWILSDMMKIINPQRITPVHSVYGYNQYGDWGKSLCTTGDLLSFIQLTGDQLTPADRTNLEWTCVVNPTYCRTYKLTISFALQDILNVINETITTREIFRSIPLTATEDYCGLIVELSPDGSHLMATARSEIIVLNNSVPLSKLDPIGKWNRLDIVYESGQTLSIWNNGELLAHGKQTTQLLIPNQPLSNADRKNVKFFVGRGLKLCFTSLEIRDADYAYNKDSEMISASRAAGCYEQTKYLNPLLGTEIDHFGRENSATIINTTHGLTHFSIQPCLYNPELCSNIGITLSFWIYLKEFEFIFPSNGKNEEITVTILSTGPPNKRGILVEAITCTTCDKSLFDLQLTVRLEDQVWTVRASMTLPVSKWTNVALGWVDSNDQNIHLLSVFVDGRLSYSSYVASTAESLDLTAADDQYICFGPASCQIGRESRMVFNAVIDSFAFWSKLVALCSQPKMTHMRLRGDCLPDASLGNRQNCPQILGCRLAQQTICLDATLDNMRFMSKRSPLTTDLALQTKLLESCLKVLNNDMEDNLSSNSSETSDTLLTTTIVLFDEWANSLDQACKNFKECTLSAKRYLNLSAHLRASLSSPKFQHDWSRAIGERKLRATSLIDIMDKVLHNIFKSLDQPSHCVECMKSSSQDCVHILRMKYDVGCPETIELMDAYMLPNNSLFSPVFHLSTKQSNYSKYQLGVISLASVPVSSSNLSFVAGGLTSQRFTNHTLLGVKKSNMKHNWTIHSAMFKPAAVLTINSPVYTFRIQPVPNGPICVNFSIMFNERIEAADVEYFMLTGRKKWKALDAQRAELTPRKETLLELARPVRCVFWNESISGEGNWDSMGCQLVQSYPTFATCSCDHASIFALASEPSWVRTESNYLPIWEIWGSTNLREHETIQFGILITGNVLSICTLVVCLLILMIKLFRATHAQPDFLCAFICVSSILFHSVLILEPWMNQRFVTCRTVGYLMNIGAVFNASGLSFYALQVFRITVLGQTRIPIVWFSLISVICPIVVFIIQYYAANLMDFGQDLLCLPDHATLHFWIMFGALFIYLLCAVVMSFLMEMNVETPAFFDPLMVDYLMSCFQTLRYQLLLVCGSWIGFVLIVYYPIKYAPYVTYAAISLQGSFVGLGFIINEHHFFEMLRHKKLKNLTSNIWSEKRRVCYPLEIPEYTRKEEQNTFTNSQENWRNFDE